MAGIFDRIGGNADSELRVSISSLYESIYLRGLGEITGAEARTSVENSSSTPLDVDSLTDITNLLAAILAQPDNISRLIFLNKARSCMRLFEQGAPVMTETKARTILGI